MIKVAVHLKQTYNLSSPIIGYIRDLHSIPIFGTPGNLSIYKTNNPLDGISAVVSSVEIIIIEII